MKCVELYPHGASVQATSYMISKTNIQAIKAYAFNINLKIHLT